MAMENKRITQLSTERLTLTSGDYVLVDDANNGSAKYRLDRLKETDSTLSVSDMAANAAATGSAISDEATARELADTAIEEDIDDLKSALKTTVDVVANEVIDNATNSLYQYDKVNTDRYVNVPNVDTLIKVGIDNPSNNIVCTVTNLNMLDNSTFSNNGVMDDSGLISTNNKLLWSEPVKVLPNTRMVFKIDAKSSNDENIILNRLILYDINGDFLARNTAGQNQTAWTFVVPADCYSIIFNVRTAGLTTNIDPSIMIGHMEVSMGINYGAPIIERYCRKKTITFDRTTGAFDEGVFEYAKSLTIIPHAECTMITYKAIEKNREIVYTVNASNDICIINGELWVSKLETGDYPSHIRRYQINNDGTLSLLSTLRTNFGHLNSMSYCPENDCLLIGSGYGTEPDSRFYIIKNPISLIGDVDISSVAITYTVDGIGTKVNPVWGDGNWDNYNIVFLVSRDWYVTKILLGKNSNDDFDGTFTVLGDTQQMSEPKGVNGICYYNGKIYFGAGSGYVLCVCDTENNYDVKTYTKHFYQSDGTEYTGTIQGINIEYPDIWIMYNASELGTACKIVRQPLEY